MARVNARFVRRNKRQFTHRRGGRVSMEGLRGVLDAFRHDLDNRCSMHVSSRCITAFLSRSMNGSCANIVWP